MTGACPYCGGIPVSVAVAMERSPRMCSAVAVKAAVGTGESSVPGLSS